MSHKLWPKRDRSLRLVDDWVLDVEVALRHVPRTRTCIQAGGAVGTWPEYLASRFQRVYTFEPCEENFPLLVANCPARNVYKFQAALGCTRGTVDMRLHKDEQDNAGAWYAVPDKLGSVPVLRIDDLGLPDVDFIQLDVEGAELNALMGAVETIKNCRPVVMLEEKALPQGGCRPQAAREWLENYGYREAERIHRDVVMVPC